MRAIPLGVQLLFLILILAACQEETPEPEVEEEEPQVTEPTGAPTERLMAYIDGWETIAFDELYAGYLTEGAKSVYGEEVYVDWQQRLMDQLRIDSIDVSFEEPEEEQWNAEEPVDLPVEIAMETIAGPLTFEKMVTLVYEEQNGTEDWFVEWDPSFILPELEEGDKILTEPVPAERGEIVDRNGKAVAENRTGYEVGVIPENFTQERRKTELANLLGIAVEEIDEKLNASWVQPHHYVPIGRLYGNDEEKLRLLKSIPGVERREQAFRYYPYGEALSHLTGYIGPITNEQLQALKDKGYREGDLIGREGLEERFEEELRGAPGGRIIIEKAQYGDRITVVENGNGQGNAIELTIDAERQKAAYEAMGGKAGTAAAVDPATGEAIILLSAPGYNPNEFVTGIAGSRYRELQNDPKKPFFNRFAASYTAGDMIDPVTELQALGFGEEIPFALELTSSSAAHPVQANILHLASVYGAFAADGTVRKPILFTDEEPEQVWKEPISADEAKEIRNDLKKSLSAAKLTSSPLAAKTAAVRHAGRDITYFAGFNPENPDLALAIMMEDTKDVKAAVAAAEKILK